MPPGTSSSGLARRFVPGLRGRERFEQVLGEEPDHGHRNAVLVLYLWGAVLSLGTVSFAFLEPWQAGLALVTGLVVASVVTLFLPRWSAPRRL